ncbi:MAG: ABC transporter permease [Cyclobacteriaceae bacterium]|nr:ABC transporter permease [Cyclobacteriaceae bacterium]UYN86675.1 MAG: ABC transporter permease [Cyclobacteriaceae bacterium]
MLKNYLLVAFRNINRQKFYAFLNVIGLTVGIASCLFITLYVKDEISYDRLHPDADRIYRVNLDAKLAAQEIAVAVSCPPMAAALIQEVPEVESAVRVASNGRVVIKYGEKAFTQDRVFAADTNFFTFFNFPLVEGNPKNALKERNTVVLTESTARKFFGSENALGKLLAVGNDTTTYVVTGVAKDLPGNVHFKFDVILTGESSTAFRDPIWMNNYLATYLKIHKGSSQQTVKSKIDDLTIKYIGPEVERFMGMSLDQFKQQGSRFGYTLIPLTDIHLHSNYQAEIEPQGDIQYVYLFSVIAVFILIIACINFMNLATARSAGRAKEVGLRKTLGSLSRHLVAQFLAESFVFSCLAAVLALGIVYTMLPFFNTLAGKELVFESLLSSNLLILLLGIVVLVGLMAGSYPAFYLTSFKVTEVLKGKVREGMKGGAVRSGLVVFQFAVSIFLIIATAVIFQQMQYVQNKNLGLNRDNVLVLTNTQNLRSVAEPLKQAILAQSGVVAASYTNSVPALNTEGASPFRIEGSEEDHLVVRYFADYDQLETMGYTLKEGRFFSRDFPADSTAIVINEALMNELSWKEAVGKELFGFNGGGRIPYKIVGVVNDFHFESLRNNVRPTAMFLNTDAASFLTIRFVNNPRETVSTIENLWRQYAGNEPFEYSFLDQDFDALFRSEQRLGNLFTTFTVLAIFIASLGLIGLAAFTAEKRTKELGIRKVLGASEISLVNLLSKEFTKLVVIALVLSIFPAWYFTSQWLQGFAFRISLSIWVFVGAGAVALVVALLCVVFQALRTARINPAKSLRYE